MSRPKSAFPWLATALLLSAGLVVTTGVLGIGSALSNAREVARLEKRRAASTTATALRRVLRDARVLELFDPGERFTIEPERIVIAGEPERQPTKHAASIWVEDVLARARNAEFADRDPAAARELVVEATTKPGLPAALVARLRLHLCWIDQRAAESLESDSEGAQRWRELDPEVLGDEDIASWLWLASLRDVDVPVSVARRLVHASPEDRVGIRVLASSTNPECRPAWLASAFTFAERVETTRRLLESRVLPSMAVSTPEVMVASGQVVFWFPAGESSRTATAQYSPGAGAVVSFSRFADLLRSTSSPDDPDKLVALGLADLPWNGSLQAIDSEYEHGGDDPVLVIPGIALVPTPIADTGLWNDPRWIPALLLVLLIVFVSLLVLFTRSHRREREALALRGEFLRSVTHELRTPLTSIRMLAESLERGSVPSDKRASYLGLMAGEATRLGALVENVLDLGRIERGERRYELGPLRLDELVDETVSLLLPVVDRADADIDARLVPVVVLGDPDALRQAILNIVDNALKYGRREPGEAQNGTSEGVANSQIAISIERDGERAVLAIEDDGPGIRHAEHEAVFEPFRRGEAQTDGSIAGTGIGLAIARSIATAHGGRISITSPRELGGARFEIVLPLAQPEDASLVESLGGGTKESR
ncbi:MAG: HAMP domain-containing histidine kinase [Planctomycetes bacterium]|nr:HAMP domain-containing histidine kinase [Planctomycetota bacterium]MCB9916916.1 HAMP domain-containing histidine kinase [Planctomycetota bacterium]